MSKLSISLDARTAKVFSYLLENAPKIKNKEEIKSKKSNLSLNKIFRDNRDVAGQTKISNIITELAEEGIIYRGVDERTNSYKIYILDDQKTYFFYQLLIRKGLI